ncbi:hypothetical protein EPUS_01901 [Endocarpon pusillum Z07020]|uniref:Uncharacterized protein n=1 Tax=Endocarpon pusillum (strain Z07020 / HMAS-L-300199) TaxID=1263415 RepID=U1GCZ8_ENDPU|nr:uncharacterized protein EPUS_01901 [Endocarpon pusillum Z07020]ERF69571.1 hypothetical protein EPUS_01901 [Endocarpon pusillum Z07020]
MLSFSLTLWRTTYLVTAIAAVDPAAMYDGSITAADSEILLMIALADAFIHHRGSNGSEPFRVAWYQSRQHQLPGLKHRRWRNHLQRSRRTDRQRREDRHVTQLLRLPRPPPSHPARISNTSDVQTIFSQLRRTAEAPAAHGSAPVRLLSRYDPNPPPISRRPRLNDFIQSNASPLGNPPTQPGTTNTPPSPAPSPHRRDPPGRNTPSQTEAPISPCPATSPAKPPPTKRDDPLLNPAPARLLAGGNAQNAETGG